MTTDKSGFDFNSIEKHTLTKPRDKAWDNWAKFEKVGDFVQGYIRDVFYRAAEGQYKEQRALTIEQADGTLVNVGVKRLPFILNKTDDLRLGDPVKIVLEQEIPSSTKGFSPTKQFAFYGTNLPENASQKTVRDLELEDMRTVQSTESEDEAEFDNLPGKATEKLEPVAPVQA